MRKLRFKLLMFLFCPLFFLGAMAQGTPPPGGSGTGGTGGGSGKNDYTQGLSNVVTDLSSTLGVDLFEEDIDNVVFSTNAFLCNSDFTGEQGPFWYILQMAMALGALFSIIVAASMAYKMMVKHEPIDVFKILKVLGIAIVLMFWYPSGNASKASILDFLAYIPNCIGSYTHDLYEAEAQQVSQKYNELAPLLKKRDQAYQELVAKVKPASEAINSEVKGEKVGGGIEDRDKINSASAVAKADYLAEFTGTTIAIDKIIMFFSLVIYRVGWWATIFCQQILLGMLTIFGPIQWAFSVLPKWEGAWAKWLIRYLTVHFYGAMLFFVGFYVLLLFDIVLSVQIENLTAITSQDTISAYAHHAFISCGYLLAAALVALKCLNLVPDLAAWMIPEGDTAFSTRNFGEGVASSVKASALSIMPRMGR